MVTRSRTPANVVTEPSPVSGRAAGPPGWPLLNEYTNWAPFVWYELDAAQLRLASSSCVSVYICKIVLTAVLIFWLQSLVSI
jgi:hypothetical protein